jgi:spectinomycin phosphotransferase
LTAGLLPGCIIDPTNMLEKPDLPDQKITACLGGEFELPAVQLTFLPLGADRNTAVYRVLAEDGAVYFLKLRRGPFEEIAVNLPNYLASLGISQVIAPLPTSRGALWADLAPFKVILYPFVEGQNGYQVNLTAGQWAELGVALKQIHTATIPPALTRHLPREAYSPRWREEVKTFLTLVESDRFEDPVARETAGLLKAHRRLIQDLLGRAGRLAEILKDRTSKFILCHSDLHAGNILVDPDGPIYIVDWDDPIVAPKERDLMFVGGGLMGGWRPPEEEMRLFHRHYSPAEIDPLALAYYRYERIIMDIAAFGRALLLTDEDGRDRRQSLHYLKSNFDPNNTIDIAYQSDKTGLFSQRVWYDKGL